MGLFAKSITTFVTTPGNPSAIERVKTTVPMRVDIRSPKSTDVRADGSILITDTNNSRIVYPTVGQ